MKVRFFLSCVIASVALLQGCATNVKASVKQNPAPTEPFSAFGHIELKPVTFKQGLAAEPAALAKIDENLRKTLVPEIAKWNARSPNGRTLTIEPVIEQFEFHHGASRVLLGPFVGSSGVLMRVKFVDDKGALINNAEFFQHTTATAGWVMGIADNIMLVRISGLASRYVIANYSQAVGGATGASDAALAP